LKETLTLPPELHDRFARAGKINHPALNGASPSSSEEGKRSHLHYLTANVYSRAPLTLTGVVELAFLLFGRRLDSIHGPCSLRGTKDGG